MDNKLEKTEFEINIMKKINREDVIELISGFSSGGGDVKKLKKQL